MNFIKGDKLKTKKGNYIVTERWTKAKEVTIHFVNTQTGEIHILSLDKLKELWDKNLVW